MNKDAMIRVVVESGRELFLPLPDEQVSLARAIWLSGELSSPPLCSGLGRCGMCRVLFHSEHPEASREEVSILGADAVARGWRLACRHPATAGIEVELPTESGEEMPFSCWSGDTRGGESNASVETEKGGFSIPSLLLLAVDLGTTSIQWQLFSPEEGKGEKCPAGVRKLDLREETVFRVLSAGRVLNPQMGAGSDVISRVAAARTSEGRKRLRELVLLLLQRVVRNASGPVKELCVAGNTAMTSILLDVDVEGLAAAPYRLTEKGGREVVLPGLPPVWIPPQPAPFVGGDLSAGMATLLFERRAPFPFLLADLGTNGEFVLALDERESLVASVPLGPSLEGIGLTHGSVAGPGSVSAFQLGPLGLSCTVLGGGRPEKICGTGYLSLLDVLLRCGFLTREGKPAEAPPTPLARRLAGTLQHDASGVWILPLEGGLAFSGTDAEELLKVKAAFSLALESLLNAAGLRSGDVARFVLGGALGEKAPVDALENLGFLPQGAGGRTLAAGNTSLAGAGLLLRRPELRERLVDWSGRCRVLELTERSAFTTHYMRHMAWGWA